MSDTPADAISKLEADHDRIEALFKQLKDADEAETKRIGVKVCNRVKIHMALEEEILYPALRGRPGVKDEKLDEGLVEHDSGKVLFNDVLSDPDQDKLAVKLQVLGEQMEHHHKEEEDEDKGIFAQARQSGVDLVEMLGAMETREAELRSGLADDDDLPISEMNFVELDASQN